MLQMYWPIALIVFSNVFYHICSKSTPEELDPLASLIVTYLVGAVCSAALYFALHRGGDLLAEYRRLNWTSLVLGLAIVGLEAGNIYMYKVGWNISTGMLLHSSLCAVALVFVGSLLYHESITLTKVAGVVICMAGLYLINK